MRPSGSSMSSSSSALTGLPAPSSSSSRLSNTSVSAELLSSRSDIDTSTPAGELVFHVMAAIGQFERALVGDRIRSGLERAKALGKVVGRPRVRISGDQVLALRAQGLSYRGIARRLRISPALAHRLAHAMPKMDSTGRS